MSLKKLYTLRHQTTQEYIKWLKLAHPLSQQHLNPFPSCHRRRGGVHPVWVTSLSHG